MLARNTAPLLGANIGSTSLDFPRTKGLLKGSARHKVNTPQTTSNRWASLQSCSWCWKAGWANAPSTWRSNTKETSRCC